MSQFRTLTPDEAEAARNQSPRKAWLKAILAGDTIEMPARPSLSPKDKANLDAQGFKMRTTYANPGDKDSAAVFVWVDGLPATPDFDDDEVPV